MTRPTARASWIATIVLAAAAVLAADRGPAAAPVYDVWVDQTYQPSPIDNPLKGFMPFRGASTTFPHSMEWSYIAWKEIQTGENTFRWDAIETFLNEASVRGHQAVFRVYADFPDRPSALPDFLSKVRKHSYRDHSNGTRAKSVSPDYDDPRMVRAMTRTIRALGERYDGDARIAFITVGFIGFWGEWHTYRDGCRCDTWMPSFATQTAVLDAFEQAFTKTKTLVRYPDVGWSGQAMGFHDDSFPYDTIDPPGWKFLGRLKSAGALDQWRSQPIGGEMFPPRQACTFREKPCTERGRGFNRSVDVTHVSWLIDNYAFTTGYSGDDYARALRGARRLGYELFVSSVRIAAPESTDGFVVDIRILNKGVAPFYYDWTVQLGIMAAGPHRVVATYDTFWRLTQVIPGESATSFSHNQPDRSLPPGNYTLLMRAVNPLASGKPLVFANAAWEQDATRWLTLGAFEVRSR